MKTESKPFRILEVVDRRPKSRPSDVSEEWKSSQIKVLFLRDYQTFI